MDVRALEEKLPKLATLVRSNPNVVGYAIGYKRRRGVRTDQLAFVVYVNKKRDVPSHERIPEAVDGIPTDVVESGEFKPSSHNTRFRPAPGGVQVQTVSASGAGTLGCYLN